MKRRIAREYAVQSLYQMEMNAADVRQVVHTVIRDGRDDDGVPPAVEPEDVEYVIGLVQGTLEHARDIDRLLIRYLKGWTMDRLSRVDRQILRLAVYEMLIRGDTPPKVAVNEAIELAKHFGTEESGRFVNGVLGRMLKEADSLRTELGISQV
jgi:N utilization substance protein B